MTFEELEHALERVSLRDRRTMWLACQGHRHDALIPLAPHPTLGPLAFCENCFVSFTPDMRAINVPEEADA
jgi:hypothetical protein